MADKQYPVHYANFVCHFGEAELLDYLSEIVIPAFKDGKPRKFKDGSYFFLSVQLLNLSDDLAMPELAICGRFVKDMVLRSEQRFDADTGTVISQNKQMETAPSAIFVLLLASHKLIYLLETASAPGMDSFRSTAANFLSAARLKYIQTIYERAKLGELTYDEKNRFIAAPSDGSHQKLTKTKLNELVGAVNLEIVALSNGDTLKAFVGRFKTLQSATLRLVKPNSELDNDDFLAAVRSKGDAVGSETSSLIYRNADGLIKAQVIGQLEAAASEGNTEIKLDGKDQSGQDLRGSNDEFKVVSFLDAKPGELSMTARRMLSLFSSQRRSGLVKPPEHALSDAAKERLAALSQQLSEARDGRT